MSGTCRIVGVLDNGVAGLTPQAETAISDAHIVIGGGRTLKLFTRLFAPGAQQYDLTGKLSSVPVWIEQGLNDGLAVVVLATGDPLCHGIGKYLIGKLGVARCEVIPNVSTLQLACARLGLAWQNLKLCSVHSKDAGEWSSAEGRQHGLYPLLAATKAHELLGVFTSAENSPGRIARMLLDEGMGEDFRMSVCEHLLQEDENIHRDLSLDQAAQVKFADLNVVILQRQQSLQRNALFGLADDSYKQRKPDKGLITKREVRAVSLARLQLRADSIVWDIGAGSGSLGLEAARLCHQGYVFAVEKNAEDAAIAQENQARMGISNYQLMEARAPQGLDSWPDPDAVFIGGSGGELAQLIALSLLRMSAGGCLVINVVTMENLHSATQALKDCVQNIPGLEWDVVQLQASRSKQILDMQRFEALNPVWIISASKPLTE